MSSRLLFGAASVILILSCGIKPALALSIDETLCGDRDDEKTPLEASPLELRMGPARNQGTSNWCYANTACDLVDEQLRISGSDAKVSLLDAVLREKKLLALHDHHTFNPSQIKSTSLGSALDLWLALQKNREVAKETSDDRALNVRSSHPRLDSRALYQPKLACPEETSNPKVSTQLSDLSRLNAGLEKADQDESLSRAFQKISNQKATGNLIELPSFTPHSLETRSELVFLTHLKKQLIAETPIIIGTCTENFEPLPIAHCTPHAVIVVGAQYLKGECTLRVRNSWGPTWRDRGYTNIKLTEYLKSQKPGNHFQMEWLEKADPVEPAHVVIETEAGLPEPGRMKRYEGTLLNQTAGFRFDTGQAVTAEGKIYQFQNEKILSHSLAK